MKMYSKLITLLLSLFIISDVYSMRIDSPTVFTDVQKKDELSLLNKYLYEVWLITNGRYVDIGNKEDGVDYSLTFLGKDNTGSITWKEDEDYFEFDAPIRLSDTVWDDIRISGLSVRTNATAPDLIAFAPATTNLILYGFDGVNTTEQCYFAIQMPHGYKLGTSIYAHVHWTPTDTNTGNVIWSLEYSWADGGEAFPAPTTISSTAQAAGGTAWVSKRAVFADAITGNGGDSLSSMLIGRLYRNPTVTGDTYEHDAALLEIDFHYEIDGLGSESETTK